MDQPISLAQEDDGGNAEPPEEMTTASPTSIINDRIINIPTQFHDPIAEWDRKGTLSLAANLPKEKVAESVSAKEVAVVPPERTVDRQPPAEPGPASVGTPAHTELRNPPDSGGEIHFLVAGEINSLRAGETRKFLSETPLLVQFHRGGDFGNAEHTMSDGIFEFRVTDQGWDLQEVETTGTPADDP